MYTVRVGRISKDISFSITSKYEFKICEHSYTCISFSLSHLAVKTKIYNPANVFIFIVKLFFTVCFITHLYNLFAPRTMMHNAEILKTVNTFAYHMLQNIYNHKYHIHQTLRFFFIQFIKKCLTLLQCRTQLDQMYILLLLRRL
jgi:hypothetical protein